MTGQLSPDATSPNSRILCKNYIYETGVVGLMVLASKASVYTERLLEADRPPKPLCIVTELRPMHKPPVASADLSISGREGAPGGAAPGERTPAARQYHRRPSGRW